MGRDNMSDCYSKMSQDDVKKLCKRYQIPDSVMPLSPDPVVSIENPPIGMIGVYARWFTFANVCFPFSRFLLSVVQYHNFHISQLPPLAAIKISCFEVQCRALGYEPTVIAFRKFYKLGRSGTWVTIEKRQHPSPCCITGYPTKLSTWKNDFFWVKTNVVPIEMTWKPKGVSLSDPIPSDQEVGTRLLALLQDNRILVRTLPEHALIMAGISRKWDRMGQVPIYKDGDQAMSLLKFVKLPYLKDVLKGSRALEEDEQEHLVRLKNVVVQPSDTLLSLVKPAPLPKVPKPRKRVSSSEDNEEYVPPEKVKTTRKKSISVNRKRKRDSNSILVDEESFDESEVELEDSAMPSSEGPPVEIISGDVSEKQPNNLDVEETEGTMENSDENNLFEEYVVDEDFHKGLGNNNIQEDEIYEEEIVEKGDDESSLSPKVSERDIFNDGSGGSELHPEFAAQVFRPTWNIRNGDTLEDKVICREFISGLPTPAEQVNLHGMSTQESIDEWCRLSAQVGLISGECIRKWEICISALNRERMKVRHLYEEVGTRDGVISSLERKVTKYEKRIIKHEKKYESKKELKSALKDQKRVVKELKNVEVSYETQVSDMKAQLSQASEHMVMKDEAISELLLCVKELKEKVREIEKEREHEKQKLENDIEHREKQITRLDQENDQLREERRWFAKNAVNHAFEKLRQSSEYLTSLGHVQTRSFGVGGHVGLVMGYDNSKDNVDITQSLYYDPEAEAKFVRAAKEFDDVEYPYLKRLSDDCDISIEEFKAIEPESTSDTGTPPS